MSIYHSQRLRKHLSKEGKINTLRNEYSRQREQKVLTPGGSTCLGDLGEDSTTKAESMKGSAGRRGRGYRGGGWHGPLKLTLKTCPSPLGKSGAGPIGHVDWAPYHWVSRQRRLMQRSLGRQLCILTSCLSLRHLSTLKSYSGRTVIEELRLIIIQPTILY